MDRDCVCARALSIRAESVDKRKTACVHSLVRDLCVCFCYCFHRHTRTLTHSLWFGLCLSFCFLAGSSLCLLGVYLFHSLTEHYIHAQQSRFYTRIDLCDDLIQFIFIISLFPSLAHTAQPSAFLILDFVFDKTSFSPIRFLGIRY